MENQLAWPKSSLNLSMPKSHLFPKPQEIEQIQPMDLSYTPPLQENTLENSEENSRENTQNQIGNYILVHQIQYLEFSRIYFFSSLKRSDWLRN